ncbi:MAG: hypothetical protein H7175_07460, partial [Burkholderiales bacterium]|nr:hypothetical protein [Anaerolineae bacterium]
TLAAFLTFLIVRLSNPDLWHPSFGGEKPMDFAYFNAVLRSTIFPPLDPWYAGGYLNYYYFGFNIVGAPVLLLGLLPSIAYNLIIPTLFALTGIAAFSVAFNVVAGWRVRVRSRVVASYEDEEDAEREPVLQRLGNPYLAGIAALLLAVVFGNLDTVRVFGTGLAQSGGYSTPTGLQDFLINEYATSHEGQQPDAETMFALMQRAEANSLSDRVRYEFHNSTYLLSSIKDGIVSMAAGNPLQIGTNRWYWAPTRVLAETPGVEGNAITEMPFFTFLYGDLHAHMINMPMLLLIMVFLLNEVTLAPNDKRRTSERVIGLMLGAGAVGLVRATNSWDWPAFLVLGTLGVAFAWWLRWRTLNRRSVINFLTRVGGFVAFSFFASLPFTTWYSAIYSSVSMWEGGRTPLWAYFDIHGLFLFLIFSLLLWETARWLKSTPVRALRGKWTFLMVAFVIMIAAVVIIVVLTMASYQVTLITVPLLAWIGILFFRPGQSRIMQYVLALTGLGLGVTLGVEFIVVDGDIGRQNTVFKFYIQAWLLFSVVGGAAFAWVIQSSFYWSNKLRTSWMMIAALLVTIAAFYPLMASRSKAVDRMMPGRTFRFDSRNYLQLYPQYIEYLRLQDMPFTLDGMDYMRYAVHYEGDPAVLEQFPDRAPFALNDDYNMIRWLQENIQGTPIIIEGQAAAEYRFGSRVSIYTGLPSVIGWNWHQRQQRTFDPMPRLVQQRVANVNAFYSTMDIPTAWNILQHYDVSYIIVSTLEQAYYLPVALAKFDQMADVGLLQVVYHHGEATVYRVNKDAVLDAAAFSNAGIGTAPFDQAIPQEVG